MRQTGAPEWHNARQKSGFGTVAILRDLHNTLLFNALNFPPTVARGLQGCAAVTFQKNLNTKIYG